MLEVHLADLKHQVDNIRKLISSAEAGLARKEADAQVAHTTEAWLLALRENLAGVEQDTEEAFEARRELAKLLVERIRMGRGEDGWPRVEITYRFGPPEQARLREGSSADGERDSEDFSRVHGRGGGEGLLRGHPKMSSYEVAVRREAAEDAVSG